MSWDAYLKPNRLEDVIFLIQYLGFEGYSLQDGTEPDGVVPRSAKRWSDIARDHPESFRLTMANSCVLSLRYYLRVGQGVPQQLTPERVQSLVENAMKLHERQAKRIEVWRGWTTMIAAVVAAVVGIAQFAQLFMKK